jgi:hypothetical protein
MLTKGTITKPMMYPMVIIVEVMASSFVQSLISSENESSKKIPQIKANLDKNNNQRINDFRLK